MFCVHCGRENPDDADFCYHCGRHTLHDHDPAPIAAETSSPSPPSAPVTPVAEAPTPPLESISAVTVPVYAKMSLRLLAFAIDNLACFVLCLLALLALEPIGKAHGAAIGVALLLLFPAYMTVSESLWSASPGKWMFRLRVGRSGLPPNDAKPSFGRILLRETIGRFAGSFFFCAGYWSANIKPQRQAWTDSVAGTVVLQTGPRRRGATALAVAGFVCYFLVYFAPAVMQQQNTEHTALRTRVQTAATAVASARSAVDGILGGSTHSIPDLQSAMTTLLPALDTYDARMKSYVSIVTYALQDGAYSGSSADTMRASLAVIGLRQDQSAILRREARIVVAYDPSQESWKSVITDLDMLDSDIHADELKIAPLLKTMDGTGAPQS